MFEQRIQKLAGRKPSILDHEKSFQSAVILPLQKINNDFFVLFEKRSEDLVQQPGEICFPGGRIERGEEPVEAALRETREELGLSSEDIEIVAALDILVSPFNTIIYPFLGTIKNDVRFQINPSEVEEIFWVPLSFFCRSEPQITNLLFVPTMPQDYPYDLVPGGEQYPFRKGNYPQHFYKWEDKIIWGLTARILNHFLDLLRKQ